MGEAGNDAEARRLRAVMLGHGFLVMLVGMIAGFLLAFARLETIDVWPFPALEHRVPGSSRGWVAAHSGGIMNGLMVIGFALGLPALDVGERTRRWLGRGVIFTGWANTAFYWLASFAPNRGLTMGGNRFGESSLAGVLAFVPAMLAAYVIVIVLVVAAAAAFRSAHGE